MVSFEEFEGGNVAGLVGYKEITGHLVFDIKLGEGMRRKARFCVDGHKINPMMLVAYIIAVSQNSVRIVLTIAALNSLNV